MLASIKAELRKLYTVRSTYVWIIIALLIVLLFSFYGGGLKSSATEAADPFKLNEGIINLAAPMALIGGIVTILLMTHEYRHNTIMYTLTASNSRSKTLLAKVLVSSAWGILFTVFFSALSPLLALLGMHIRGLELAPQQLDIASLAWRVVFYGWGLSMFALMFATLLRNQVAVIVSYLMVPSTVEGLLSLLLKHNIIYLPFNAIGQVLQHQMFDKGVVAMSYGHAAFLALAYIVGGWIVAWVLFLRRDAN
jgi:ABC-type transport system involved in multi-copper enzyme maturation permease subunit